MLRLNFIPFPDLSTERLTLRKITLDDKESLFMIRSDERAMKYIDKPRAKTIEDAVKLIELMLDLQNKNEAITWAISLKKNPTLIGTIGFWRMEKEHYRAEIGYMIHPDFYQQGLMNEAIAKVIDYGFNAMEFHSIEANVNPENEASIKLLEKHKFVREAYFRQNYFYNGNFLDTAIYSLLKTTK